VPSTRITVRLALFALTALIVGLIPATPRSTIQATTPAPAATSWPGRPDVALMTDLPYLRDGHPNHRLDLYLPAGAAPFPVVVFVHGGCWNSGDKNMYAHIGRHFASRGVGVAVVGYRLFPEVSHPAQASDVAAAFAWVHRNVAAYGGDPSRMFLCGHSAGGHLATLLATDRRLLAAHGLAKGHVRGLIALSGIYSVDFVIDLAGLGGVFAGADRGQASPMTHAAGDCPPSLLLYAEDDLPTLGGQARAMHRKLEGAGAKTTLRKVEGKNHTSLIIDICLPRSDYGDEIVRWVKAQ
jgi:acetyl esterase/lipase